VPTEYDPTELARLLGEGKSLHEIADIVDGAKADEAAAQRDRSRSSEELYTQRQVLLAKSQRRTPSTGRSPLPGVRVPREAPSGTSRLASSACSQLRRPAIPG
jgi:hypothetical protein